MRPNTIETRSRFFELSLDLLCIASLDGYFQDVNPAWERVLGYTVAELKARPFIEFVHPADREPTLREARRLADVDSYETISFENRYRHKDGSYRVLLWNARSDHDAGQIHAVARDMTLERALKQELEHFNRTLEQRVFERTNALARSNRDLEQFAYIAAHDLQEPLRTISSFVELLAEENGAQLSQNAQEYVTYVSRGAERMRTLLDALLSFARTRNAPPDRVPIAISRLLSAVVDDLQSQIRESGAIIEWDDLPTVHADPTKLRQVLQNLLSNALKFKGDAPPRVHVSARLDTVQDEWVFRVADQGIGIPAQHQKAVFDLLRRLHSKDDYPGAGIGLAICQRIIEAHGGRIWAASPQSGPGTHFYFTIPGAS